MIMAKKNQCVRFAALSVLGLGLLSASAGAAITYNFDVNGATAGFGVTSTTYNWDATTNGGFWSNNAVSTTGGTTTNGWVQGNFPKFQPAGTPNYTITVSNVEQITGIFASTAQTLKINALGSGGLEAINTAAPNPQTSVTADGFLGSGSADVTINAPISGAGAIEPSNGGNLRFNGNNSYSGGTFLVSTSTLVHFGTDTAFGTGPMNLSVAGFAPLLASGGTTRTLGNNFVNAIAGGGVNFGADANTPVVSTGTWTLGANNLVLRNNGIGSSTLTLANAISGTAGITLSSNNSSIIIFSGANLYTGTTTITAPGATGAGLSVVTLRLGAANTVASSSSLIMSGGILDPDGLNQIMPNTTMGLTLNSTIDFINGGSEVDLKNSSAVAWTAGKILNLANWDPSIDKLRFGTDPTGLTAAQLGQIEFNGTGLGTGHLDANGYVVVPEPATMSLIGIPMLVLARRRRKAE